MMKYLLVFSLVLFSSCYTNESCIPSYVGEFKIDLNAVSNPEGLDYIKQYKWDTVKLISTEEGDYYFKTTDKLLKQSEGRWSTSSGDTEGACTGHIKQKNLESEINGMAFDIMVKIPGEAYSYSLPFRKIDGDGKFVP